MASEAAPDLFEPVSAREMEVLQLLADGSSNQEIAHELVIAVPTVKRHLGNIFRKLTAQSRTQAVARARALHLLYDRTTPFGETPIPFGARNQAIDAKGRRGALWRDHPHRNQNHNGGATPGFQPG